MIRWVLAGICALALCWPAGALARYKFDTTDLPKDFLCDEEWSDDKCLREKTFEGYWNRYGKRQERWFFALAHNPNLYFSDFSYEDDPDDEDYLPSAETVNLLDISYSVALRRYSGWTAAVGSVCPKSEGILYNKDCRPVIRIVRPRQFRPNDPDSQKLLAKLNEEAEARGRATTQAEMAEDFGSEMEWLEADLRNCNGALPHFRNLPAVGSNLWGPPTYNWLEAKPGKGRKPSKEREEIIVTADGDGFIIRAGSLPFTPGEEQPSRTIIVSESNGGVNYDWGKKLTLIIRPCLKPSAAPAPWQKYLTWKAKAEALENDEGETQMQRIYHLDRGYERLEEKLQLVSADIERVGAD